MGILRTLHHIFMKTNKLFLSVIAKCGQHVNVTAMTLNGGRVNSPEWHSSYLPSDVGILQSDRHCGTCPPVDQVPFPRRAGCSRSRPNARPTVAGCRVAAPGRGPDPAKICSIRRYPARSAGGFGRRPGGWAIGPAGWLALSRYSGSGMCGEQEQERCVNYMTFWRNSPRNPESRIIQKYIEVVCMIRNFRLCLGVSL